eukprot:scaffold49611_cov66-Phaeocystis_antarctica.AAC.6
MGETTRALMRRPRSLRARDCSAVSHVGRKARHEAAVPDESTAEASCAHARESEAHVLFILGQVPVAAEVVLAAQLVVTAHDAGCMPTRLRWAAIATGSAQHSPRQIRHPSSLSQRRRCCRTGQRHPESCSCGCTPRRRPLPGRRRRPACHYWAAPTRRC